MTITIWLMCLSMASNLVMVSMVVWLTSRLKKERSEKSELEKHIKLVTNIAYVASSRLAGS